MKVFFYPPDTGGRRSRIARGAQFVVRSQRNGLVLGLREEQGVKFVHEPVVEGRKIFQAVWACLLELFKKEDLRARVELLQQLAQFTHCVAAGGDAENVVNETLNELLSDIFAGEVPVGKLAGRKEFTEWNGLSGKWETLLWFGCHAESTPRLGDRIVVSKNFTGGPTSRQVCRRFMAR